MTAPALSWLAAALVALPLGYVLPGDRMLAELERQREERPPLRIEAELAGRTRGWPEAVVIELHPELGFRVSDDAGRRWLVRRGSVVAGSDDSAPAWIPDLEILVLRVGDELRDWCRRAEVNLNVNELGRCGELDCFVLGGREGRSQLWLEKDRFDVIRWVSRGRSIEFLDYTDWDGQRFPSSIELRDRKGAYAILSVRGVVARPGLSADDFQPAWVRSAVPATTE